VGIFKKNRPPAARPRCPECLQVVDPKKARVYADTASWQRNKLLAGIYCCSDHLLDAHVRGWALSRVDELA
jgi:hypothetical protein